MSNYNSFILPQNNENNCLEHYYRYIVGMSMNQQPAPTTTIVPAAAPMNQNEYQKIYVDTLVGKYKYKPFIKYVY